MAFVASRRFLNSATAYQAEIPVIGNNTDVGTVLGRGDELRNGGIPTGAQIRFNADFWRSAVDCDALRDDQWERLKDFVPGGRKGKRGPRSDNRRFLNA